MDTTVNWNELRDRFVKEGWEPTRISAHYQVKRMYVAQRMAEDNWRGLREQFIREEVNASAKGLGLEGHIAVADQLVYTGKKIAEDLLDPEADLKLMRSKAETYRTTVEATNLAMRLARDVRGIRLGQPSAVDTDDRDTAVIYTTRVVREQAPPTGEAVNA